MLCVLIIAIFFVVSSLSFSNRLAEGAITSNQNIYFPTKMCLDFAANTWKVRWWLLDGWLALLYLITFTAIAYIWRPTGHNRRYVIFFLSVVMY